LRLSENQLRGIIREELLCERREANISDLMHDKTQQLVRGWVDKLVGDLANRRLPKIQELDQSQRARAIERLTELVTRALGDVFASGGESPPFTKIPQRSPRSRYGLPG